MLDGQIVRKPFATPRARQAHQASVVSDEACSHSLPRAEPGTWRWAAEDPHDVEVRRSSDTDLL